MNHDLSAPNTEQQALIDALVAAFAMSDAMTAALVTAIQNAIYAAAESYGYEHIGAFPQIDVTELARAVQHRMRQQSVTQARSVQNTYRTDIERFIIALVLAQWGKRTRRQFYEDVERWARSRSQWKSAQLALVAVGGALAAAAAWVTQQLPADTYQVQVEPPTARCPVCAEYAGNVYSAEDAADLVDVFPAHVNCVHYLMMLPVS